MAKACARSSSENYPTAALAEVTLAVDRWAEVGAQSGRLAAFTVPRSLPEA